MNIITELKEEWEYMRQVKQKVIKKLKRPYRRKSLIERTIMSFDPTFEADIQAVAEKDAAIYPAGFSVTVEVPPTTPVAVTEKFVPGQPPAVV